jgi:peptidoglycan hydrolase-like protein with peptidoglycan-binding domain
MALTLQTGSRGNDVANLQRQLAAQGYNPGSADGIFGPRTRRAVEAFQQAQGIGVDGIAGRRTFEKLQAARNTDSFDAGNTTGVTPRRTGDYRELVDFARARGFTVTSTNGGQHNVGSSHYEGRAIDVRTRDKTNAQVNQFIREARAAGYHVGDERRRPAGQAVWSGPHLHLEIR